jgi:hypothetical protein
VKQGKKKKKKKKKKKEITQITFFRKTQNNFTPSKMDTAFIDREILLLQTELVK